MARRRSIELLGVDLDDGERDALTAEDRSFYGLSTAATGGDVSSDASDESEAEPADKRVCYEPDEDEFYSEDDDDHAVTAAAGEAHVAASIADNRSIGCGCRVNHWLSLDSNDLEQFMVDLRSLKKSDLKQFALGALSAGARRSASAQESSRKWSYSYLVLGHEVCRQVFLDVYSFGRHTLRSLQESASVFQVTPREQGGKGATPHNALPSQHIELTVSYIRSYANTHDIPQPAAPRGRAQAPPIYLPASSSKKSVYSCFQEAEGAPRMSYATFGRVWRAHCKDIVVQKPHSDVSAKCDKLREAVWRSKTEEETQSATTALQQHLAEASKERQYYNDKIDSAKVVLQEAEDNQAPESHITFDFAQQFELPQHTRQVGPLYFKSRFRVQMFGICNEAKKQQKNYIFHEGETIGVESKQADDPNTVISMLDHYFTKYANEPVTYMHADNCVGQNKNQYVIGYLCWRTIHSLSDELHLSFMRVGHTCCSVDGYFGLVKMKYRSSEVDSTEDVSQVINGSCAANSAERYSWH